MLQGQIQIIGTDGENLIKQFEGLKLTSYQDQRGIWTIGWGTTSAITPVTEGMTITLEQAEKYFLQGLKPIEDILNNKVKVDLLQCQFDALCSLIYNIGSGNFAKSSVFTQLNLGNYGQAATDILLWNESEGKVDPGLVRRRQSEKDLFLRDVFNF